MSRKPSVIIPAHNESKRIGEVLRSLKGKGYEVIVVDDGSTDGTGDIAEGMGVRCVRVAENRGKGYACREGVQNAKAERIVIFDADGQFNADDIRKMVKALDNNDLAIGQRSMHSIPLARRASNRFAACVVSSITGGRYSDVLCGFRAMNKKMFMELGLERDRYEFESEMAIKAAKKGMKIAQVPVSVRYFSDEAGMGIGSSLKVMLYILKELASSLVKR